MREVIVINVLSGVSYCGDVLIRICDFPQYGWLNIINIHEVPHIEYVPDESYGYVTADTFTYTIIDCTCQESDKCSVDLCFTIPELTVDELECIDLYGLSCTTFNFLDNISNSSNNNVQLNFNIDDDNLIINPKSATEYEFCLNSLEEYKCLCWSNLKQNFEIDGTVVITDLDSGVSVETNIKFCIKIPPHCEDNCDEGSFKSNGLNSYIELCNIGGNISINNIATTPIQEEDVDYVVFVNESVDINLMKHICSYANIEKIAITTPPNYGFLKNLPPNGEIEVVDQNIVIVTYTATEELYEGLDSFIITCYDENGLVGTCRIVIYIKYIPINDYSSTLITFEVGCGTLFTKNISNLIDFRCPTKSNAKTSTNLIIYNESGAFFKSAAVSTDYGIATLSNDGDFKFTPNGTPISDPIILSYESCCGDVCGLGNIILYFETLTANDLSYELYCGENLVVTNEEIFGEFKELDENCDILWYIKSGVTMNGTVYTDGHTDILYIPNDGFIGVDQIEYCLLCECVETNFCNVIDILVDINPDIRLNEIFVEICLSAASETIEIDIFEKNILNCCPDGETLINGTKNIDQISDGGNAILNISNNLITYDYIGDLPDRLDECISDTFRYGVRCSGYSNTYDFIGNVYISICDCKEYCEGLIFLNPTHGECAFHPLSDFTIGGEIIEEPSDDILEFIAVHECCDRGGELKDPCDDRDDDLPDDCENNPSLIIECIEVDCDEQIEVECDAYSPTTTQCLFLEKTINVEICNGALIQNFVTIEFLCIENFEEGEVIPTLNIIVLDNNGIDITNLYTFSNSGTPISVGDTLIDGETYIIHGEADGYPDADGAFIVNCPNCLTVNRFIEVIVCTDTIITANPTISFTCSGATPLLIIEILDENNNDITSGYTFIDSNTLLEVNNGDVISNNQTYDIYGSSPIYPDVQGMFTVDCPPCNDIDVLIGAEICNGQLFVATPKIFYLCSGDTPTLYIEVLDGNDNDITSGYTFYDISDTIQIPISNGDILNNNDIYTIYGESTIYPNVAVTFTPNCDVSSPMFCQDFTFNISGSTIELGKVIIDSIIPPNSGDTYVAELNDGVITVSISGDSMGNVYINGGLVTLPVDTLMGNLVDINLLEYNGMTTNETCDTIATNVFNCPFDISLNQDKTLNANIEAHFDNTPPSALTDMFVYIDADLTQPDNIEIQYESNPIISATTYLGEHSLYVPKSAITGSSDYINIIIDNSGLPSVTLTALDLKIKCCDLNCSAITQWIDNGITPIPNTALFGPPSCRGFFFNSFGAMASYGFPPIDGNAFSYPSLDELDMYHLCIPASTCAGFVGTSPTSTNPTCNVSAILMYNPGGCTRTPSTQPCLDMVGQLSGATYNGVGVLGGGSMTLNFTNIADANQFITYTGFISGGLPRSIRIDMDTIVCASDASLTEGKITIPLSNNTPLWGGPYNIITQSGTSINIDFAPYIPIPQPCPPSFSGCSIHYLSFTYRGFLATQGGVLGMVNLINNLASGTTNGIVSFQNSANLSRFATDRITVTPPGAEFIRRNAYLIFDFETATNGVCPIQRKFKFHTCGDGRDPDNWYLIEINFDSPYSEFGPIIKTGSTYTGLGC